MVLDQNSDHGAIRGHYDISHFGRGKAAEVRPFAGSDEMSALVLGVKDHHVGYAGRNAIVAVYVDASVILSARGIHGDIFTVGISESIARLPGGAAVFGPVKQHDART